MFSWHADRIRYTAKDLLHRCAVVAWRALLFMGVNLKAGEMGGLIFLALLALLSAAPVWAIAHYAGWGVAVFGAAMFCAGWWLRGRAA